MIVKGDGSPEALQLRGALPPVAAIGALYARPADPFGSEPVGIERGPAIANESRLVATWRDGTVASAAVRLTVKLPPDCGVPEMFPEKTLMPNPPGSPVALQLTGELPPAAAIGATYA